mmetsp:Transcript_34610/g.73712  ORF Transcript_34610/g.73712 Transcript_34610/m.73712 type:complete len:125 (+) Transcript_34610:95-469(+)
MSLTPWETGWVSAGNDLEWMQNFEEVVLRTPVVSEVGRGDVSLKVKPQDLFLKVSGKEICSGQLFKEVDPEEASWAFDTKDGQRYLVVTLQKINRTAMKSARTWESLWMPTITGGEDEEEEEKK